MGLIRLIFDVRESILDLRGVILGLRGLIWVPGTDFKPERARFEPERPGGMYIHMEGQTDGRTNGEILIRKFSPVSYRTSALWSCCPKTSYPRITHGQRF